MTAADPVVIVGAGQAGGRAAEALRKAGHAGRIVLIGDEPEPPYERPPLSKAVLTGDKPAESTRLLPPAAYAELDIALMTGRRVAAIDAAARRVELADGSRLAYGELVLATGGRVRTLPFAPPGRPGVHYLRTLADARALGAALKTAHRLVVIGGGFLGLEVAASARRLGLAVTVIEARPNLLDRALDPRIARHVEALHRRNGVDIRLGAMPVELAGGARLEAVVLDDGARIPADLVLVSIGILPNVELAAACGCATDNGIVVDEYGAATLAGIHAAGDVANHPNPILGRRLRLESWQNAQNQAIAVARNLAGERRPYAELPWFWSDQFDLNIQFYGVPLATDAVVLRGDPQVGRFIAFNLAAGRLVGATAFNLGGELRQVRRLIETGAAPDPAALADTGRKLKDLAAALLG